jgi:hypothetical protein
MLEGVLSGRLVAAFVDGPVLHPTLEACRCSRKR